MKIKAIVKYYVKKSDLEQVDSLINQNYELYATNDGNVLCLQFHYKGSFRYLERLTRKVKPLSYEFDDIRLSFSGGHGMD